MNPAHIRLVAAAGARELLRDRRTLFVNFVLPLLLYPLIGLFAVQVAQLPGAAGDKPARILTVLPDDLAAGIAAALASAAQKPELVAASPSDAAAWRSEALALPRLEREASAGPDAARRLAEARERQLRVLRSRGAAALLVAEDLPGGVRLHLVHDLAERKAEAAAERIEQAVARMSRERSLERLRGAGLAERDREPVTLLRANVAPVAEAVRMRVAGIVPLLLVILAATGAFYAALDLLPGMRERGTLEALLTAPVARRDLILGKLLVVWASSLVSALANLCSLVATLGLLGSQLAKSGLDVGGLVAAAAPAAALLALAALPLTLLLAALALGVAGLAQSQREANNLMSPLLLVVLALAAPAAAPALQPSYALDVVPVTGLVTVLKACLQDAQTPWLHLGLALGSATVFALVLAGWTAGLLEQERFRYPGLVRAGWGRWRRWGPRAATPTGLEAMAAFACCAGAFVVVSGLVAEAPSPTMVAAPLFAGLLLPALVFTWAADLEPGTALFARMPSMRHLAGALLLVPAAMGVAMALGAAQQPFVQAEAAEAESLMQGIFVAILDAGGIPLLLLCVAVAPGICEELVCRGLLLSGLRRGLGAPAAVVVSSLIFAAMHGSPARFLPQLSLGIILAVITLRTGSIIPAICMHAAFNGTVVLIAINAADMDLHGRPAQIAAGVALAAALPMTWFGARLLRRSQPLHSSAASP